MTLVVLYFEYRLDDTQLIRALGHWLVYLQLIKYFLPKTPRDDWFLFLLGLMQVLIGSVVSQSDRIGLWLFVWAMLAIWVLGQFFLQREALPVPGRRGRPGPRSDGPAAEARRPVRRAAGPALCLRDGPRAGDDPGARGPDLPDPARDRRARPDRSPAPRWPRHLTGFDEEVALGQFGEILENDSVVMTVEFTDGDGKTIGPPAEPLWRGVTLVRYETRPVAPPVASRLADVRRLPGT